MSMTPTTYAQLCDEVYARILGRLKRREEETLRFAVKGTAKKVLNNSILERFFRSLDLPELSAESHSHVSETELIARLGDRNLYDFLAIMIFATCTINAARTFTTKLLIHESWPRDRFSLPVGREQLEELFGEDIITPDKFLAHQACFCPITIVKGHEVVGTEQERLPYLEEELKASGSFGRVYKVKIAEGHFLIDPLTGATNKEPVTIARKDYLRAEDDSGGEEPGSDDQIMKQIVSAERTCRNIVEFFGSVAIGSTTYSLFMPLAICDLKDFMMKKFSTEPDGITEKAALIYSAHGLAGGLDYLHEGMMSGNDKLVCYHMDLKPSNILIYLDGARSEPRYIWKISDFGMSRLKVKRQDVGVESDNNFNSWILSRRKPQEPSASGTENRRGEGTYLAPETIAATPIINEKADVWSLGCVISVLFAYLEEGGLGVDLFADKRVNLRSADGYDRFFIRNWGWVLPFKAHPEVRAWHDRLIHQAKRRNRKEGQAIEFILKYLENEVFKEQSKRCDAKKLKVKLHETYEMYALAEGSSDRPSDIEHLARGESSSMRQWKLRWPSRTSIDYVPESKVSRRFLDYRDGLKGCAFAHDGSLTAFWTDRIISLYTSQNLRGNDARISTLVSEFSLQDTSKGYWKSVSLTERYLIATTSGEEPQFHRFALLGGHAVDANLKSHKQIPLPLSEVFQQAISPESHTMAFVVGDRDGDQKPGSLVLAPVASPNQSWWRDKLDWPAKDVIRLFFTTDEDLYLVVRPHLSALSREYKVYIVHINVTTKRHNTLIIESSGSGSSSNVALFTTFAPFRHRPDTFAIVTQENQLHIRSLSEGEPTKQAEIKGYRVLRLMMGWDDTMIFAIGTPEAESRVVLLEIKVPRGREKQLVIKELEQLPGLSYKANFTEMLSDQRPFKYFLIVAPGKANQHAIYQVALTHPDTA